MPLGAWRSSRPPSNSFPKLGRNKQSLAPAHPPTPLAQAKGQALLGLASKHGAQCWLLPPPQTRQAPWACTLLPPHSYIYRLATSFVKNGNCLSGSHVLSQQSYSKGVQKQPVCPSPEQNNGGRGRGRESFRDLEIVNGSKVQCWTRQRTKSIHIHFTMAISGINCSSLLVTEEGGIGRIDLSMVYQKCPNGFLDHTLQTDGSPTISCGATLNRVASHALGSAP